MMMLIRLFYFLKQITFPLASSVFLSMWMLPCSFAQGTLNTEVDVPPDIHTSCTEGESTIVHVMDPRRTPDDSYETAISDKDGNPLGEAQQYSLNLSKFIISQDQVFWKDMQISALSANGERGIVKSTHDLIGVKSYDYHPSNINKAKLDNAINYMEDEGGSETVILTFSYLVKDIQLMLALMDNPGEQAVWKAYNRLGELIDEGTLSIADGKSIPALDADEVNFGKQSTYLFSLDTKEVKRLELSASPKTGYSLAGIQYSCNGKSSPDPGPKPPLPCVGFKGRDGILVIEAEHTSSPLGNWVVKKEVEGYTGSGHLEYNGNRPQGGQASDPIRYTFKVNKAGYYRLIIRAHKNLKGPNQFDSDDGFIRMEGDFSEGPNSGNNDMDDAYITILNKNTKFTGGNPERWGWAERLDLEKNKKRKAVYQLKEDKEYTLIISGRSKYWNIDRIVLFHESIDIKAAKDPSILETTCEEIVPPNSGNDLPDPVAHWTFEGHVEDVVGELDGTMLGNPVFVQDAKEGETAILLDGNDRIETSLFMPSMKGTVSFWMKSESIGYHRILGMGDQFEIRYWKGLLNSDLFQADDSITTSPDTLLANTWYHVTCTWHYPSNTSRIYINGDLTAESTYADDEPEPGLLTIGTRTGNSQYFNGILDDMRIYDSVLTVKQIRGLYHSGHKAESGVSDMAYDEIEIIGENTFELSVYPNPSSDGISTIKVNERALIQVFDLKGRVVEEKVVEDLYSPSPLTPGIYLVKAKTESDVRVKKWIVK